MKINGISDNDMLKKTKDVGKTNGVDSNKEEDKLPESSAASSLVKSQDNVNYDVSNGGENNDIRKLTKDMKSA